MNTDLANIEDRINACEREVRVYDAGAMEREDILKNKLDLMETDILDRLNLSGPEPYKPRKGPLNPNQTISSHSNYHKGSIQYVHTTHELKL